MKKIIFMGTSKYATTILKSLLSSNYEVVAIFTKQDKPVGRKAVLTPPDVKKFLIENKINLPILQPLNLKGNEIKNLILSLKPNFIVVAAYGEILPKNILDIVPCINLHASILPKYRGASPIQEAILNGEKYSGITAMRMGVGLDDGDILGFSVVDISNLDATNVFDRLAKIASDFIIKILDDFKELNPLKQYDVLSSKCGKIKKIDGQISLNLSAKEIFRKFLAYHPWPGIFLENGTKILDMSVSNLNGNIGEILAINKDEIIIGTSKDSIAIKMLQEVSKNSLSARDFVNGKRLEIGSKFY